VDAVFGHVTRVMKGLRDAQVAWARQVLLVYAPTRGIVMACAAPNGEVVDAAKVDKHGHLFQCVTESLECHALFVSASGVVADLVCPRPPPGAREPDAEACHFDLPEAAPPA